MSESKYILPRDKGAAPLDFVIAVMAFLAALALGASLVADRAALPQHVTHDLQSLMLVQFRYLDRRRQRQAGFRVGRRDAFEGLPVAPARADVDRVERNPVARPVRAERAGLCVAGLRQLVVVRAEERRLSVANESQ